MSIEDIILLPVDRMDPVTVSTLCDLAFEESVLDGGHEAPSAPVVTPKGDGYTGALSPYGDDRFVSY